MKFLERHKTFFVSLIFSTILCGSVIYNNGLVINFTNGEQNSPYEIAKLISSISGTVLGFLLTAIAMLTAVMDRKLVENMRKTGHYRVFIVDCFVNCFLLLVVIVLGVACLFIVNPYLSYVLYLTIIFTITAIFMLIEQGRRFLLIFTRV